MRNAAGQPSDRVESLRLLQLLLEFAAFGHVARDDHAADDFRAVAHRSCADVEEFRGRIGALKRRFEDLILAFEQSDHAVQPVFAGAARQRFQNAHSCVRWMSAVRNDEFLEGRIPRHQLTIAADDRHEVGHRRQRRHETRALRPRQSFRLNLAFGRLPNHFLFVFDQRDGGADAESRHQQNLDERQRLKDFDSAQITRRKLRGCHQQFDESMQSDREHDGPHPSCAEQRTAHLCHSDEHGAGDAGGTHRHRHQSHTYQQSRGNGDRAGVLRHKEGG